MTPKPCQYTWVRAARLASSDAGRMLHHRPLCVQVAMLCAALDACWTDTKSSETVGRCWREMYDAAREAGSMAYLEMRMERERASAN